MAYYALLDINNIVTNIITGVDETTIQIDSDGTQVGGSSENWESWYGNFHNQQCVRTSYNGNIRGVYAGIGYYYDKEQDIFVPPTVPNLIVNEVTYIPEDFNKGEENV